MAKVGELMTTEIDTLEPESTLRDALEALRGGEVSGAPVTVQGALVGVVSVTDILEFQATEPGAPTHRAEQSEWGELGLAEPWEEGTDVASAYFVDFWSDAGAEVTARFDEPDSPEWDTLAEHVVGEIMSRTVVTLPSDADVQQAARLMTEAGVQRILVVDDGTLKGILTATDMVRAVAEDRV